MTNVVAKLNKLPSSFRSSWYVHFASCFYVNIYCIMGCYFMLCHNNYGYSLLFYKVYMKRENVGSWNSGLEKEQILKGYSVQLQNSWNSMEHLKINKEKSSPKMKARGATPCSRGWGARPPTSWAPWWLSDVHLLPYEVFRWEKNRREPFGMRLRRHEAEPWRNQSRAPAELFCWDTSLREGEIIAIVITNSPLIGRGQSPSTSSPAPSPLKP